MKIDLFKPRSNKRCIREAFCAYIYNLPEIFRRMWLPTLLYAVFMAATLYLRIPNKALHDWGASSPITSFIIQTVIYLLMIFVSFVFAGGFFRLFNDKRLTWNLWRYAKVACVLLVVALLLASITSILAKNIPSLLSFPSPDWLTLALSIGGIALLLTISVVMLLPFAYAIPKYMLNEKDKLKSIFQNYKIGLRQVGGLFVTTLILSLIFGAIMFIIAMPVYIIVLAQTFSQLGALQGDDLGIPAYFPYLVFGVLVIFSFILTFAMIYSNMVYVFIYGSTTSKEYEIKQMEKYHETD